MDSSWIEEWRLGVPPDGFSGFSGPLNWHLIYTLGLAARLEEWAGDALSAQRWQRWRAELVVAAKRAF